MMIRLAKRNDTFHAKRRIPAVLLAAAFLWIFTGVLLADKVVTVGGRVIEGHITEETSGFVKIQTLKSGLLTLPRSQIKSVSREDVGLEEAEADRSYVQKDYYKALDLYERVKSAGKGSGDLEGKIETTRKAILQKERDLFDGLFRDARELSAQNRRDEARATLQKILEKADPKSLAAGRARRAIASQYYLDSRDFRNMVRYTDAVASLERAVEVDPAMVIAHFELARLYRDYFSDAQKAVKQFEKAVQVAKEQMALDASVRKQYEDVEPKEANLTAEKVSEFRFELSEMYSAAGDKQKAAESFQALLEDSSQELPKTKVNEIIKRLGDSLTDINLAQKVDRTKTLQGLDIALKYNPNLVKAWFLKGRIYFEDGASSPSIQCFTKAIQRAAQIGETIPKDIYLFRAKAYMHEGRLDSARADLMKQLETEVSYEVRRLLGEVLLVGLDYEGALAQFNAAIQMEPSLIPALLSRAKVYRQKAVAPRVTEPKKLELQEQARQDIEKVLETNPSYLEAILEKGRLLRDQNRSPEAFEFFNKVVESFKNRDDAHLTLDEKTLLASALCERGDVQRVNQNRNVAQADFERALKIRPGFPVAYRLLGELAKQSGNFEKARDYFIKAIELAPEDPDLEISLGLCYQELKQYPEAIAHFENHRKKGGSDLRVQDWIKECQTILQTQPR